MFILCGSVHHKYICVCVCMVVCVCVTEMSISCNHLQKNRIEFSLSLFGGHGINYRGEPGKCYEFQRTLLTNGPDRNGLLDQLCQVVCLELSSGR